MRYGTEAVGFAPRRLNSAFYILQDVKKKDRGGKNRSMDLPP